MRQLAQLFAFALAAVAYTSPASAGGRSLQVDVVGPRGEAVEDAVVYLLPTSGQKLTGRSPLSASVAQQDREFVPHVSVVQTGAAVRFPNQDPIRHHVYSFSKAKKFEIKLYAGEAPDPIVFDTTGIVTMGCNVHDWMLGYVFVVDTPWFGKSDASGHLRIDAVEDGDYEARIWHPRQRQEASAQALKVASETQPLHFVIEVTPRKPHYKPPLDPLHYTK